MDKPITVAITDIKKEIVNIINNSNLHIAIIEPIIKDLYDEVHSLLIQKTLQEKEEYENSLEGDTN